jgi:hypothetical protein
MAPKIKKKTKRSPLSAIERAAKRAEQKAAGALDGRYRTRKVESGKRYSRRRKHPGKDEVSS